MIPTHEWNTPDHAALSSRTLHHIPNGQRRGLRILASVASQDGVYGLEELRHEPALHGHLGMITQHLLDRTGVYTLTDLRQHLRDLERGEG